MTAWPVDISFLQATWPILCKGPSMITETLLWLCRQLHVLCPGGIRDRNSWPSVAQSVCGPTCGIEGHLYCFLGGKVQGSARPTPTYQARSCQMPSFYQLFSSRGWKLYLFFFFPVERACWVGDLSVGKAVLKHSFSIIPELYSHSHWFWDIWIIAQVLNQRIVFILLNI